MKSRPKRSHFWLMPEPEFRAIALSCKTMTEFMERLGAPKGSGRNKVIYGSGYNAIRARVTALHLTDHFETNKHRRQEKHLTPIGEHRTRSGLRRRIISDGLLPYECEGCGNGGAWQGKPLALQLDHKNGKASDHRLDNVRFLCPNCHSQTDTWTGRNKAKAA